MRREDKKDKVGKEDGRRQTAGEQAMSACFYLHFISPFSEVGSVEAKLAVFLSTTFASAPPRDEVERSLLF